MIDYHGAGNLAKVLRVFEDNPEYCYFTVSKTGFSYYLVRFLDEEQKLAAEMSVKLVYNVQPIDVSYARYPDAAQVGLRNTFMLTSMDEDHIAAYWARKKKGKGRKETIKGTLGRMSKELKATQVKAAKSLLATLSE